MFLEQLNYDAGERRVELQNARLRDSFINIHALESKLLLGSFDVAYHHDTRDG